jgi:hypothetical protein
MNRHFYNFVAIFNWSSKTNRRIIVFPIRNKHIITVLGILARDGIIAGYEISPKSHTNAFGEPLFGKKLSNYYTPAKIFFKDGLKPVIKTVGSPGKRMHYSKKKLARVWGKIGTSAHFYVSSSRLGICKASQLVSIGEGGTPLFIVHLEGAFNI